MLRGAGVGVPAYTRQSRDAGADVVFRRHVHGVRGGDHGRGAVRHDAGERVVGGVAGAVLPWGAGGGERLAAGGAVEEAAVVDFGDILKIYGPMAIGWIVAGYLIKFIIDRYQQDIESRSKLASALEALGDKLEVMSQAVREIKK